jgi:hypothetical protein
MQTIIETEVSYDQVFALAKKLPLREKFMLRDSLVLMLKNTDKPSQYTETPEQRKERYRRNREALEASIPKRTDEERAAILARLDNFPVADDEEAATYEDYFKEKKQWQQ